MANKIQFEHLLKYKKQQRKQQDKEWPLTYRGYIIRQDKGTATNYANGTCLNIIYNNWPQLKAVIDAIK